MRTPPQDLIEADLAALLAEQWRIDTNALRYAPVGFGSHHWVAETPTRDRWFVTADAVADVPGAFGQLRAALTTADRLRTGGLRFVVAPISTTAGSVLSRCGRFAVAVFRFLPTSSGPEPSSGEISRLLADLHGRTDQVRPVAPVDDLRIDGRADLDRAVSGRRAPAAGPYGTAFAHLIRGHHDQIRDAFARHDAEAEVLGGDRTDWVITHGEPKRDNIMLTDRGPMLIDWDTARLAPAARDLWMTDSVAEYQQLTGRPLSEDQLDFYRRRWDLSDLATFAGWFVGPHQATPETRIGWRACQDICERLGD